MDESKKQLIKNFIPRLEAMIKNQKSHLNWIKKHKPNKELIFVNSKQLRYYENRLMQYQEFINK